MMALGQFVFSLSTLAYQSWQRQTTWRYATTPRIGARSADQFLGPGEDTITLTGWFAPELTGTRKALATLREQAQTGEASVLVDGTGNVYGAFVIVQFTEEHGYLHPNGTPRRIAFTLVLKHVDDPHQPTASEVQ